jgi:hypothetical protein
MEVEMEQPKPLQVLTVYNKPFFVNELLRILQPNEISPKVFTEMVSDSRPYDQNTILTAMNRQIDNSGLVPCLAGTYEDPQDVLEALLNFGHQQLIRISRLDPEMQIEVFETLKGDHETSLRALMILDECHEEVIHHLDLVKQRSPLAQAIDAGAKKALVDLYMNPKNVASPMFDDVVAYQDRSVMYAGEPHISYPKHMYEGAVVEVWQFFFMPAVDHISLAEPFSRHCVGEELRKITPKVFRRGIINDNDYNPRTPAGFIGLLGKVGGALPKLIARQVKKNAVLHERVMREEAISSWLYDLLGG